jgi:hypothetical protein
MGREAWLAAITAALGLAEGCHHDADNGPAAVREVASIGSTVVAEAQAPAVAPSASTEVAAASSTASVVASTSATPPTFAPKQEVLQHSNAICGASIQSNNLNASCGGSVANPLATGIGRISNASCGATAQPLNAPIRAEVTTHVNGGDANDQRAIAQIHPRLRACATRALSQNPGETGTMRIIVSVAVSGDVTNITVASNGGVSAATSACMTNMLRRVQFSTGSTRQLEIAVTQTRAL